MDAARGHEQCLPGLEGDGVEQECGGDAGVAREGDRHLQDIGVHAQGGGGPCLEAGRDLGDQITDLLGSRAGGGRDDVGEDLPDTVPGGIQAQGAAHPPGQDAVQAGEDLDGPTRSAESGDRLETGKGQDHLRLVVGVLVVAGGVVQGDARLFLQGVALGRLGLAGVNLEGQRLLGGDELEEER